MTLMMVGPEWLLRFPDEAARVHAAPSRALRCLRRSGRPGGQLARLAAERAMVGSGPGSAPLPFGLLHRSCHPLGPQVAR